MFKAEAAAELYVTHSVDAYAFHQYSRAGAGFERSLHSDLRRKLAESPEFGDLLTYQFRPPSVPPAGPDMGGPHPRYDHILTLKTFPPCRKEWRRW